MSERKSLAWMGFVFMAFAVVGLAGIFATYAAPLPLERALSREAALDEALAAIGTPDEAARLRALAPRLGRSADALGGDPATVAERIRDERAEIRAEFAAEAERLGWRLRFLILVITIMGGGLGASSSALCRGAGGCEPGWPTVIHPPLRARVQDWRRKAREKDGGCFFAIQALSSPGAPWFRAARIAWRRARCVSR